MNSDRLNRLVATLRQSYGDNELRTKAEIYTRSEMGKFIRKETGFDPLPREAEEIRAAIR